MEFISVNETEGGFAAHVNVLPGCVVVRNTRQEAVEALADAAKEWIADEIAGRHDGR